MPTVPVSTGNRCRPLLTWHDVQLLALKSGPSPVSVSKKASKTCRDPQIGSVREDRRCGRRGCRSARSPRSRRCVAGSFDQPVRRRRRTTRPESAAVPPPHAAARAVMAPSRTLIRRVGCSAPSGRYRIQIETVELRQDVGRRRRSGQRVGHGRPITALGEATSAYAFLSAPGGAKKSMPIMSLMPSGPSQGRTVSMSAGREVSRVLPLKQLPGLPGRPGQP